MRRLGEHRLKDFEQPKPLFQLLISNLPGSFPPLRTEKAPPEEEARTGSSAGRPPLAGREAEPALLRERLKATRAGHGSLVLPAGEPGIGKTRLAEELAGEARLQGMTVLWGRCWEGEGAPPFYPWLQVLRSYCERQSPLTLHAELGTGAADLAQLLPELQERLPDLPPLPPLEPESACFRPFEAASRLLLNASQAKPLLIFLDDLHWADKASLLLLQLLMRDLGEARMLVVGTYRDTDLDRRHPLAEVLTSLRRAPRFERLLLHGLSREAVERLLEARAGHELDSAGQRLAEVLWRETEGKPFFIGEVVRHLAETGRLLQHDGQWAVAAGSIAELGIPEGVREVIGRRLSHLSEGSSRLLSLAAVVGREFGLGTLQRASGEAAEAVESALEEAEEARLVEETPGTRGRYRFSHALVRETLYAELSTIRRVRLHRRVGEALEALYAGNPEPYLAELAHHFLQAAPRGDVGKAVDYARRAGDRTLSLYAYEEAAGQYEHGLQALELQEPPDERVRWELLIALGEALNRAGTIVRARHCQHRCENP